MNAYFKGQFISGPRGPAGPDGNPVGTVISFMGTAAPESYLVCDGAEYSTSEYPKLASLFREQFGAANHFGGDGVSSFAVPDMRNLFLRGYHGEAEEALSGDVGERQEATNHPGVMGVGNSGNKPFFSYTCEGTTAANGAMPSNQDSSYRPPVRVACGIQGTNSPADVSQYPAYQVSYTSRPVNMAVLYCIKAVESPPAENVYSTEETRIGTWIDGKPLYRKVYNGISGNNDLSITVGEIENLDKAVDMYGFIFHNSISGTIAIPDINVEPQAVGSAIKLYAGNAVVRNQPFTLVVEYTKITDGME